MAQAEGVTLGSESVTHVVTEHGVAALGGLRGAARARALVGIAAPEHREALERECSALLQRTTSE